MVCRQLEQDYSDLQTGGCPWAFCNQGKRAQQAMPKNCMGINLTDFFDSNILMVVSLN
jgi:hypothetical protein